MITIIVGTEPNQYVAQKVLEHSIRTNTRADVSIRFVEQKEHRLGGTNFGFVRFYVPRLANYTGRAIYMDADQLVLGDVAELEAALHEPHAIAVVSHPEGTFGGKPVPERHQSSVMVLDCAKLTDWTDALFERVVPNADEPGPGQHRYKDFMYLSFVPPALLQPLDPRWNHFNIVRSDTRLVHFSYVRGQPWKTPSHELAPLWRRWLDATIEAGLLTRGEVLRAVLKGHIHPVYIRTAIGR